MEDVVSCIHTYLVAVLCKSPQNHKHIFLDLEHIIGKRGIAFQTARSESRDYWRKFKDMLTCFTSLGRVTYRGKSKKVPDILVCCSFRGAERGKYNLFV
jgi:hypothetical protein